MKITHVGIYVSNLEKSKDYYIRYFGGKSNEKYVNGTGFSSYFLQFDSDASLEIMHHIKLVDIDRPEKSVGMSHLAFSVGSKDTVLALTEQITSDGYALLSAPRNTGDGYFESCVADPDGNRVEITI